MRLIAMIGACALGLVAGCGGGSDESKVKETGEAYYHAYAKGDGERACALLTAEGQKAVGVGGSDCKEAIAAIDGLAKDPDIADKLKDASIVNVKVSGSSATADAEFPGEPSDKLRFEKSGDEWKISDPAVK